MVISSSSIQALPELLTTQRDSNSSPSDLDSLLATRKITNGFNLVSSALAAKHTLTIHFSCPVVFKQTDYTTCLSTVVSDTMSFQTDVLPIAMILEGGYLYLIESLRSWKIQRIRLSINRSGSCCAVVVLRYSEKKITTHEIVDPPIARQKKIILTFVTFIFVKIFALTIISFLETCSPLDLLSYIHFLLTYPLCIYPRHVYLYQTLLSDSFSSYIAYHLFEVSIFFCRHDDLWL